MNRYACWVALALLPLAACASKPPPAPLVPPPPPPVAKSDVSFIQTAAQGGMAEVQLAQLAEQNSNSKAVKAFADQMIKDHTAANDQLKQIAANKGETVPSSVSDDQKKTMATLQGEMGRQFDQDYLADQIADHQEMLMVFQAEAAASADPDLKGYAAATVPTIQEHLTEAQKLASPVRHHRVRHHHHPASNAS